MSYLMNELCWVEPKYVCQNSADAYLLTEAVAEFSPTYDYLRGYSWEYKKDGKGSDTNDNGKKETNCWYLVASTLEKLGYVAVGKYRIDPKYFCEVRYEDARPGDIIAFNGLDFDGVGWTRNPNHIAFLAGPPKKVAGAWTGRLFEAANPEAGIRYRDWVVNDGFQYLLGIYRPKRKILELKCKDPDLPNVAFAIWIRDPLLVDLDGGGIKTVGLNAGIRFDHDKNGHKELTGWVAAGDGVLMLDMNGNGRLDSGRELFGGMTILPNGVTAANGFQALAFYDANGDGRIDANDPVWSQLRVWQHLDYDSYYESESLNTNTPTGRTYFVSQDASGCG